MNDLPVNAIEDDGGPFGAGALETAKKSHDKVYTLERLLEARDDKISNLEKDMQQYHSLSKDTLSLLQQACEKNAEIEEKDAEIESLNKTLLNTHLYYSNGNVIHARDTEIANLIIKLAAKEELVRYLTHYHDNCTCNSDEQYE